MEKFKSEEILFLHDLGEKAWNLISDLREFEAILSAYKKGYIPKSPEDINKEARVYLGHLESLFGYKGKVCQFTDLVAQCYRCPLKKTGSCHGAKMKKQDSASESRSWLAFLSKKRDAASLKTGDLNDVWDSIDKLYELLTRHSRRYDYGAEYITDQDFIEQLSEIIAELRNKISLRFLHGELDWPSLRLAKEEISKK